MHERGPGKRLRLAVVFIIAVLLMAGFAPISISAQSQTKLYIGHSARLTAQIPTEWSINGDSMADYIGADGFIRSDPIAATSVADICTREASARDISQDFTNPELVSIHGSSACRMTGAFEGFPAIAYVIAHPFPFDAYSTRFGFVIVYTDTKHADSIMASVDFSPERVSPPEFVASVIDLVEARAYWSDRVDWEVVRKTATRNMELVPSMTMAYAVLGDVLASLRAAGDNHSIYLRPDQQDALSELDGYGFLLGGTRVLLVHSGGPADRAGLKAGDVIEAVDGQPAAAMPYEVDPFSLWKKPVVELGIIRAPGDTPISIRITADVYDRYSPPTGQSLAGGAGYVLIPGMTVPERTPEFVRDGATLFNALQSDSPCGWIVDLRINWGGNYMPMVASVGPLVGNGTLAGWKYPSDKQVWVSYDDGVFINDGISVADFSDVAPKTDDGHDLPIAVLTSGNTSSSGEVTTLAFVGNPMARSFGKTTGGFSTSNLSLPLFDGSLFRLAVAAMTDRNGVTYLDGIPPDEEVDIDWNTFGTTDDPVIIAATEWLHQQPACAAATPAAQTP